MAGGDFRDRVGGVGRFQVTGKQVFLLHGLRTIPRVNAGTPQKKELFHLEAVGCVNDVGLDGQVLVNKLRRIGTVGPDAPHLRGSQKNIFGPLPIKKCFDPLLPCEVQFPMRFTDQIHISGILEFPQNGGPHQPPMTGNVNF